MAESAADKLMRMAETFRQRGAVYGDNYKQFGNIMRRMFPDGITVKTEDEWNRLHLFIMIMVKMTRYSHHMDKGHADSIHDAGVYAAMLAEVDDSSENRDLERRVPRFAKPDPIGDPTGGFVVGDPNTGS